MAGNDMTAAQDRIDGAFELFQRLVDADAGLRVEFEASAAGFYQPGSVTKAPGSDVLARRRHLEWFLLERGADQGMLAIETLVERYPTELSGIDPAEQQAFLDSHASVFEVTGVDSGQGMWLRDLASLGEYPMQEPEASQLLREGDMIVGRIFPVGDALYHASRAAAFYRDEGLLEALRRDLEHARTGRRASLRLAQSEIETMFFGTAGVAADTDAVGIARRLLIEGGVEREDVEEILGELANEPYEPERPLPGAHDVLGVILDQIAFETAIDLEAARQVLLRAWADLSRKGAGSGAHLEPSPAPRAERRAAADVAQSIAEFDRKRQSGLPLDQVFLELERDLGIDDEAGDEEDTPAPDFPGVVGAMVEEFFWQTETEQGPDAARALESLRSFARFADGIGVFENVGVRDLIAYTCHWLPESGELANADDAKRALSALQSFCRWTEEQHELPLLSGFKGVLQSLHESLPRVAEANRRRTRASDPAQGELFECLAIDERAQARVRDRSGMEHDIALDPLLAQWLRPGDRLRGRISADRRLSVYCCYPPEARSLEA